MCKRSEKNGDAMNFIDGFYLIKASRSATDLLITHCKVLDYIWHFSSTSISRRKAHSYVEDYSSFASKMSSDVTRWKTVLFFLKLRIFDRWSQWSCVICDVSMDTMLFSSTGRQKMHLNKRKKTPSIGSPKQTKPVVVFRFNVWLEKWANFNSLDSFRDDSLERLRSRRHDIDVFLIPFQGETISRSGRDWTAKNNSIRSTSSSTDGWNVASVACTTAITFFKMIKFKQLEKRNDHRSWILRRPPSASLYIDLFQELDEETHLEQIVQIINVNCWSFLYIKWIKFSSLCLFQGQWNCYACVCVSCCTLKPWRKLSLHSSLV